MVEPVLRRGESVLLLKDTQKLVLKSSTLVLCHHAPLKICDCLFSLQLYEVFRVSGTFFVLLLYVQVNSYGQGGTVSLPNHTFSWASLNTRLTSNLCTYFRL